MNRSPLLPLPLSLWSGNAYRWLLLLVSTLISILLVLASPLPVAATSPQQQQLPQGEGAQADDPWLTSLEPPLAQPTQPAQPKDPREPPPLLGATPLPPSRPATNPLPPTSLTIAPNNPLAWMGLGLNPGKWLLDSVLGATTGMLFSITAVLESFARFANGQIVDLNGQITSTSNTAFGFLFTTPEALTVAWSGAPGLGSPQSLHDLMRQVALSILVVICTYRALLVLTSGMFREGLVDLMIAFLGGLLGIQGAWWFCTLFIRVANLITERAIAAAFGGGLGNWLPLEPQSTFWASLGSIQGVSLTIAIVTLIYWATLSLLAIHALVRIIIVNLMIIVSPFAGLAIATGGGWNYARVWFFRFVELLATPLIWGMTLGFGRALLSGFGVTNQPILGPLLAVVAMLMVFQAPRLLGFAAQEAVTGARSLWRMAGRSTAAALMAPGMATGAGAAAGTAAAAPLGNAAYHPPIPAATTQQAAASGSGSGGTRAGQEWDGLASGTSSGSSTPRTHHHRTQDV